MNQHITFIPVTEIDEPLTVSIGLSGGSGTGKTYTALRVARGIAETVTGKKGAPIGYVDTENRRALHYKKTFPEMQHFDFQAVDAEENLVGFGPERWIEAIDAAESAGLPVLILDSFSHAWEGVGGVLDMHATILDKLTDGNPSLEGKRSLLAWAKVKPRYRRLIDRIVRAKTNIIICTRAKPVMQNRDGKNARPTKTRRNDVPWDPAADGDLIFEMTNMIMLDPAAPGCPVHQIKVADQFKGLFDRRMPMTEETGKAMAIWAKGEGESEEQKTAIDAARDAARNGSDAFRKHWTGAGMTMDVQKLLHATVMDELRELASQADIEASREMNVDPLAVPSEETKAIALEAAAEAARSEAKQHVTADLSALG